MGFSELESNIIVSGLTSAFIYKFDKNFHYEGERHNGWEFVFVDNGKIIENADNDKYIVKRNELICHKPMEFHNLSAFESDATAIIFCFECKSNKMKFFENKIFTLNQYQRNCLYNLVEHSQEFFLPKNPIEIARHGSMEKNPNSTVECSQYIKNTIELLILSLFTAKSTETPKRINSYENHIKRTNLTENIKIYLERNMGKKISLKEISKVIHYSISTAKTVFKAETGYGIIEYYNLLRLKSAKQLLCEHKYTINEISNMLGFNDSAHFVNFFKKHTGISPKKFIK